MTVEMPQNRIRMLGYKAKLLNIIQYRILAVYYNYWDEIGKKFKFILIFLLL